MSGADFRSVIDALSQGGAAPDPPVSPVRRVAVLGAGAVGRLLACEALAAGMEVRLHSVYGHELSVLDAEEAITVRGQHLVGSYAVGSTRVNRPSVLLESSVDGAVAGADLVIIATPSSVQATYASLLAPMLTSEQVILVVPGRFLGAVALQQELILHGCRADVTVGELSASPYVATPDGSTLTVHAVAARVECATLPVDRAADLAARLSTFLPMLHPVDSPLDSGFATVTGVVTAAPLLTNTAALDSKDGAGILLKDLVRPALSQTLLRRLDDERRAVAFHYGVRELLTAGEWLRAAYDSRTGVERESSSDDLSTVLDELEVFDDVTIGGTGGPHMTDDVPNTLVPLSEAGRIAEVPTPATDAVVSLAGCLLGVDQMTVGRKLGFLGLDRARPADARRLLSGMPRPSSFSPTWWRL